MQQFRSRGDRHEFTIDGKRLWLNGVTFNDLVESAQISAQGDAGGPAFRAFITRRIRPWWRRGLLTRLGFRDLFDIYRAWVGADAEGEASGSSQSDTPTSSEQTSDSSTESASTT